MLELKTYEVVNGYTTVNYRDDRRHVQVLTAPRNSDGSGGWLGQITLTNLANGERKSISSTTPIFDRESASCPFLRGYLTGLWKKHLLPKVHPIG